jgi:hypothetical protein
MIGNTEPTPRRMAKNDVAAGLMIHRITNRGERFNGVCA